MTLDENNITAFIDAFINKSTVFKQIGIPLSHTYTLLWNFLKERRALGITIIPIRGNNHSQNIYLTFPELQTWRMNDPTESLHWQKYVLCSRLCSSVFGYETYDAKDMSSVFFIGQFDLWTDFPTMLVRQWHCSWLWRQQYKHGLCSVNSVLECCSWYVAWLWVRGRPERRGWWWRGVLEQLLPFELHVGTD